MDDNKLENISVTIDKKGEHTGPNRSTLLGGEIIKTYLRFLLAMVVIVAAAPSGLAVEIDRTVLPIPEPKRPLYTELDVRIQPMVFSADETADVGIDLATPVVESIGSEARSRFTGKIPKVIIEVK